MNECLDFWNHHLKGKPSLKQENAPKLIWYQCTGSVPPVPLIPKWPGTWYSRNNPNPDTAFKYYLNEGYLLDQQVLKCSLEMIYRLIMFAILSFALAELKPIKSIWCSHNSVITELMKLWRL